MDEERWHCPRCGSPRWVAASLTGPVEYGGRAIKQCVPCGHYSNDPVGAEPKAQEDKPKPVLVIGPAKRPDEVGLEPPMLETRARRQHADQLRQQYRERRRP